MLSRGAWGAIVFGVENDLVASIVAGSEITWWPLFALYVVLATTGLCVVEIGVEKRRALIGLLLVVQLADHLPMPLIAGYCRGVANVIGT